jgi:mxaC protein
MSAPIDFASPWMLFLLPLALLPLLPRRDEALPFSWSAWLPPDRVGRALGWVARAAAALAMAAIVVGLAGPGRSHLEARRTGRGAEILILMDRSGSMNDVMASRGVNTTGDSKNKVARVAIGEFVDGRPNDRFAFMMFGIAPILAVPFTFDHAIIRAAIDGTQVGRGMPDTQLGRGLLAAIRQFDGLPWTGHRAMAARSYRPMSAGSSPRGWRATESRSTSSICEAVSTAPSSVRRSVPATLRPRRSCIVTF